MEDMLNKMKSWTSQLFIRHHNLPTSKGNLIGIRPINTERTVYSAEHKRYLPVFKIVPETYRWDGVIYKSIDDASVEVVGPIVRDGFYLLDVRCCWKLVSNTSRSVMEIEYSYIASWVDMNTGKVYYMSTEFRYELERPTSGKTDRIVSTKLPNGTFLLYPMLVKD